MEKGISMNWLAGARSAERRAQLTLEMSQLEATQANCGSCSGICCTFVANSVATTPLETMEILDYLKRNNRLTGELRQKLQEVVSRYRLDQEVPGNGSRNFLRRTYTCPFLGQPPRGCGLSRSIKPYGCLGFNPKGSGITDGQNCASDISLLEVREDSWQEMEQEINQNLRSQFFLDWEKLPMPVALLALWDRVA